MDSYLPACETAEANWRHFSGILTDTAGFAPQAVVRHEDALARRWEQYLPEGAGSVFIPLNPPYGRRVPVHETASTYRRIGRKIEDLAQAPVSVRGFILCPDEHSWRSFLRSVPSLKCSTSHFMHGGIDIRLCAFATQ